MSIYDYKKIADDNATIGGINVAEGCQPSTINNAIREMMADTAKDVVPQLEKIPKILDGTTPAAKSTALESGVKDVDGTSIVLNKTTGKISASGLPIFSLMPVPFSTVLPGNLSVCRDNGVLTSGAFPDAYNQLVALQGQSEANIVTMAQYASEMTAQGGICARFALDTATQTFRVPCMPGTYWRGVSQAMGLSVGDRQIDQMRPITGGFSPANGAISNPAISTGAFQTNTNSVTQADGQYTQHAYVTFDSARLGVNYNGADTHPLTAVVDYQMKMYGAVTDAGAVTLAQLIAAMTGKLDTSAYQADAWGRIKARGRILTNGTIANDSFGLTSASYIGLGQYRVFSAHLTLDAMVFVNTMGTAGGYSVGLATCFSITTPGQVDIYIREGTSLAAATGAFVIQIYHP